MLAPTLAGSWSERLRHVFRFGVEDIDEARRRLLGLGVAVAETERIEGVIAFCDFVDPDGNRLSLYEVLG